jgi:hypothetical protein
MARHPFDVLSFAFGLLFAAFGLLLLGGDAVRASVALPWAGPIAAIGLGLILVVAARPRRDPLAASEASDPADPTPTADAGA